MTPDPRADELDRILRRKHQFVIDTLHAIRTPLQGIERLAETSLDKAPEPWRRNLSLIARSADELRRLVGDLLEIERIEVGEVVYEFVHFDLADVVDEVLDLAEAILGEKRLRLERDVPPDLPPVHGDVRKIRQVLLNFIANAVQFTNEGWVRVSARPSESHVRVDVADSGIGITEDEQEIVWEQFRQVDGAISPDYEGSGLGLSINKKIVDAHRGEIGLASEPGEGSTFFFTVPTCESGLIPAMKRRGPEGQKLDDEVAYRAPRRPGERLSILDVYDEADGIAPPDRPAPVKREPGFREAAAGQGEKILVVDASPVSLELLGNLLSDHGYEVLAAPDGPTALGCIEAALPHLVLTELWLPAVSGYDLVKRIRENAATSQVPIILLTARRNQEDIAYGLNLGADDYVQKPFDRSELLARIAVLLRLAKTREELRALNASLEEEVKKRTLELGTAYERLYLSEKLSSLGLLTAGIAHELNNPLAWALSNVAIVRERLAAREALRAIRHAEAAGREVVLEELAENPLFAGDVADFRRDDGDFERFLAWVEATATEKGGADADLFPAAVGLLDSAEDGLGRAKAIVADLSAFSRPGVEEPGPMDLNRSVERTLTLLGSEVRDRQITVERDLDLDSPVRGVAARVEQVLLNLVQNAVQASPAGARILVRTTRDGDHGVFAVEDEGAGIGPDERARVFDPFFTTKPVGEGTGLGLSICYRIVEDLSGEISFRGRSGGGTVFTVRLPMTKGRTTRDELA
ncbi:MAG: ATP-binding protein [Planctomycetota bacterium]